MKKVLFAVALGMGLGSSVAFAGNMVSDVEIVVMVNDYKPIEVKDLPQAVQGMMLPGACTSVVRLRVKFSPMVKILSITL